jgi:UDP-GlcNAc3NAcA epimerase
MKILTILGARPQFIKAATVSRAIRDRDGIKEIIVHTGQHFDANMSDVFFDQLNIPRPNYNLGISSLSHGAMTGRMLEGIEELIQKEIPDWVLVYGDTNSTLAGALAASKLHVPVAHIEAGLRSHNPKMPEEVNRVLTDRVSALLFCPTQTAVDNLQKEGFPFPAPTKGSINRKQCIENVGDVMYDAVMYYRNIAREKVRLDDYGLKHKEYALCTMHRQENTDDPARLNAIFAALREISTNLPVVMPLHPRTHAKLSQHHNAHLFDGLTVVNPLPYLEMQCLQMNARIILTDSGGIQKEAYFHRVPCITLRDETEWVETVESGWNRIAGANRDKILADFSYAKTPDGSDRPLYGDGHASKRIVDVLL